MPGVYRVPLPLEGDALKAVNVYVLVEDQRATLIDAGWSFGRGLDVLADAVGALELDLGQIDRVLVTHMHRDHYTLAIRLRRLFGTRVVLGAGECESIDMVVSGQSDGQRSWLQHWGAEELRPRLDALPPPPPSDYADPDEWLDAPADVRVGARILRAVPTPGHTRGHLVFVDLDRGLLFAGDHVLPEITPSIGFEPCHAAMPLADYLSSLQLMKELPDLAVLPAHGPLGRRSHARVDELVGHHGQRLAATAQAVGGEMSCSALEIARTLPWTRQERDFGDLDAGNQMLAVAETAAHLDVLTRDGVLRADAVDGTRCYRLASGGNDAHRDE